MTRCVGGRWRDKGDKIKVVHSYDHSIVDTTPCFYKELESGNIHINRGPQWQADLMPYGGLKESRCGKEGPRYAVEEMTELKMVCFHLRC